MSYLSKIRDFIEGNYHYFKGRHTASHINEQALYRASKCQDCLTAGKCRHCGCTTPQMFFSPNKVDALNKWDKMLDESHWEEFKNKDTEYKLFEKEYKIYKVKSGVGDKLYREQQKLLGYTPPLSDPFYPYDQRVPEGEVVEDIVGDSDDVSRELPILQSSDQGAGISDTAGLPGIGRETFTISIDSQWFPGNNDDAGTASAHDVEEEDRREEHSA